MALSSSKTPTFRALLNQTLRFKSTTTAINRHHNHEFAKPSEFLGSWKPETDPRKAQLKLAQLRKEYANQVKELRKEYIYEMELQRAENQRKEEAKREARRLAKEERKAAKAQMAQDRAAERKVFEEEFRKMLLKEREEKFKYWKVREEKIALKKEIKKETVHRESSMWIDEKDLEKKILEAIVDTTPL